MKRLLFIIFILCPAVSLVGCRTISTMQAKGKLSFTPGDEYVLSHVIVSYSDSVFTVNKTVCEYFAGSLDCAKIYYLCRNHLDIKFRYSVDYLSDGMLKRCGLNRGYVFIGVDEYNLTGRQAFLRVHFDVDESGVYTVTEELIIIDAGDFLAVLQKELESEVITDAYYYYDELSPAALFRQGEPSLYVRSQMQYQEFPQNLNDFTVLHEQLIENMKVFLRAKTGPVEAES